MYLLATDKGFTLAEPNDFTSFRIEVGDIGHDAFVELAEKSPIVEKHELPRHLWVSIDFLRGELGSDAEPQLRELVAYAKTKGWLNEAETHLAAHIVVPDSAQ